MATKEHNAKFVELRSSAIADRPVRVTGNHSNDSDDPLMLTVDQGMEMSSMSNDAARRRLENVVVPEWLKKIKPLEQALDNLLLEMAELSKMHGKKLHNLSFQTKGEDTEIANQSKKITRRMRDIKDEIKKLGSDPNMSPQVKYMRDNIQKLLASRLQDIGNKFRKEQLRYQSELSHTTEPKKTSATPSTSGGVGTSPGFGDKPVPLDDDSDDDENIAGYDIGLSEQQQARAETNRIRINQRMQEIRDIAQQVEELGQMFTDIASMIHEQGSLLDRIDYNIESADHSIIVGKQNLDDVIKGEKGFSKRLCFLMLLILIFGAVVIAVILTKR